MDNEVYSKFIKSVIENCKKNKNCVDCRYVGMCAGLKTIPSGWGPYEIKLIEAALRMWNTEPF